MNSEKYRKLSISAVVTGILPYVFTPIMPFITDPGSPYEVYFSSYAIIILYFYIAISFSLAATAILCGSIDLKRIKRKIYSSKGKGLGIVGVILGAMAILYILFVLIIVLVNSICSSI